MQKHHGEEGQDIRGAQVGFPRCKGLEITRGNQRELAQEQLKLIGGEAVLEQEHQTIDSDQHPGDHRRVAGRDSVPYRDHLRLFDSMSRMPDNIWRFRRLAGGSC